jgi:hypothetical protein
VPAGVDERVVLARRERINDARVELRAGAP